MGSHLDGKPLLASSTLSWHLLDLPGHGKSLQNVDMQTLVDYINKLNSPFHLVGYSFGGRIAQKLASHPSCLSLTLMSSKTFFSDEELSARRDYEKKLIEDLESLPFEEFIASFYASPLFSSLRRRKRLFESYLLRKEDQSKENLMFALKEFSIDKVLSSFPSIPILGLYGMLDLKYAKTYLKLPSQVMCVSVPSSGHVIHLENTSFCLKTLETFIGQVEHELASMRTL
jgi:pimeloyl-ACP methyl ester carboxylesterase